MLSLVALLAVFEIGTMGYVMIDHVPIADAAYMTALTLSTVGYQEVWELSGTARLWNIGVITIGIATVSIAFTSLLALFVSGELRQERWRKKLQDTIDGMNNHVILCGYGRMGQFTVADLKALDVSAVVVEQNKDRETDLREKNIPFVIGDATDEEVLMSAGLMRARALVALLPHDADNVFITMTAHTLRPDLQIIARSEKPQTENKLKRAGASRAVSSQAIGARHVANVLTKPHVVDFFEIANKGVDLEMEEYEISEGSPLCNVSLQDSLLRRKTGAIVVAIKRENGETVYNPEPHAILKPKDTLVLVGRSGVSQRLDQLNGGG